MEASSGNIDFSLFKSWSPKVGLGHSRGIMFYIGIYRENSSNFLLKNYHARKALIEMEASSGSVDVSLFKSWSPGLG